MDRRSPGAGTVILHLDPVKGRHPSDVILRELTEWAAFFLFAHVTILDPIPCSTYLFSPVSSTCLVIFANQPAFHVFMQYFCNFFFYFFCNFQVGSYRAQLRSDKPKQSGLHQSSWGALSLTSTVDISSCYLALYTYVSLPSLLILVHSFPHHFLHVMTLFASPCLPTSLFFDSVLTYLTRIPDSLSSFLPW
jgi:hypothetical protein